MPPCPMPHSSMQPSPTLNRAESSCNTLWIVSQLFIDTCASKYSGDVTAEVRSITLATDSQFKMVDLLRDKSDAKKFANADVYRRRAELMRLLHPEEREGTEPALGHCKSGATVVITMESATSSVFLLP